MSMDIPLLSSPLLYSLNYSIFYHSVGCNGLVLSEYPKLKPILTAPNAKNLRVLHLMLHYGIPVGPDGERRVDIPENKLENLAELNLPLVVGEDRLPSVRELKISDWMPYDLSASHCEVWKKCMDFSALRILDLGFGCPGHFFTQLAGEVPNLESLSMGFKTGDRGYGRLTAESAEVVAKFIEEIKGLKELRITNFMDNTDGLFPAILRHAATLETLAFHTTPDARYRREVPPVWTISQLETLRERCTKLYCLEMDIRLSQETGELVSPPFSSTPNPNHS
jgi:hypothetical protein